MKCCKNEQEILLKNLPPGCEGLLIYKERKCHNPIILARNDNGWIELFIQVSERTNSEDLRNVIPYAIKARTDRKIFLEIKKIQILNGGLRWKITAKIKCEGKANLLVIDYKNKIIPKHSVPYLSIS